MDYSLRALTTTWMAKIQKAWEQKAKDFGDDAEEAMRFFNGPYDWLYSGAGRKGFALGDEEEMPAPSFRMTCNKVAEMVQLFGPALYHQNPVRTVSPRQMPEIPADLLAESMGLGQDPMAIQMIMQAQIQEGQSAAQDRVRALLIDHYLNYTPHALNLKEEARWAIDEAIIKGMGTLWVELYTPPGSGKPMVGSFYDSVDNLLIDPDSETIRDAKWIARRCVHPYWEVERLYNLPPDSLRQHAHLEGQNQQAAIHALGAAGDWRRKQGTSNDLIVYWKVYSKMGLGGRLQGIDPNLRPKLEPYGDYCFLVVCENCPYPLNLPPPLDARALGEEQADDGMGGMLAAPMATGPDPEVMARVQWPTPYWADGSWPFQPIYFHSVPRKAWPMSHLKPGMGELKFLNWAYSFLAGRVRIACRDFVAIMKSAGEELKDRIKHGPDYTVLEIEQLHGSIDNVVKFLQHPQFNPEIYKVIEGVTASFERRTGLTELMYGLSSRQLRSAQEAQVKADNASIRPEDMAQKVEDAMSDLARKEALALRWNLTGEDVKPVMGQMGANLWEQLVVPTDPGLVVFQLEYRVEAGSSRKPNKALERDNMQSAMQNIFPTLVTYAQSTGIVDPVNNLMAAWARSIDLEAAGFMLPAMPPPLPPAGEGGGGEGGEGGAA